MKRRLKNTQKQTMTENRQAQHRQIMEANENYQSMPYKLIRRQRKGGPDNLAMIKFKKYLPQHQVCG